MLTRGQWYLRMLLRWAVAFALCIGAAVFVRRLGLPSWGNLLVEIVITSALVAVLLTVPLTYARYKQLWRTLEAGEATE